jgi:diguanylate cyclase (GGDEF)-like protein
MCSVPIALDDLVVVRDATADPRFSDNPWVTGVLGAVRTYVGVPVRTFDGYPVGTLCVVDPAPRDVAEDQLSALRDLAGQVEQLLELRRQRAELVELLAQTGHVATHDALTGLANRRLLTDRLEHALARAQRTGRWPIVCYCDVDRFKDVNDRYGHPVGDAVLVAVGEQLRAGVRALDTVARVGGDEFAVLCEDTGADDVDAVTDRLRAGLELLRVEGLGDAVTVSIGAVRAAAGATAATLLRAADRRMYERKAALTAPAQPTG